MSEQADDATRASDAGNSAATPETRPEHGQDARRTPRRRKRRWLRYSLRTFLLLVTVCCVWLGLLVHRVNKQKAAVQWVKDQGGEVYYDFEWDDLTDGDPYPEPPGPKWLVELIGVDYFADVAAVVMRDTRVMDLGPIPDLTDLRELDLQGTRVNNLAPLKELVHLQGLSVAGTSVADVEPLRDMRELERLNLGGTPVSNVKPLSSLTQLQELWLSQTRVTDLTPLTRMNRVKIILDEHQEIAVPNMLIGRVQRWPKEWHW